MLQCKTGFNFRARKYSKKLFILPKISLTCLLPSQVAKKSPFRDEIKEWERMKLWKNKPKMNHDPTQLSNKLVKFFPEQEKSQIQHETRREHGIISIVILP